MATRKKSDVIQFSMEFDSQKKNVAKFSADREKNPVSSLYLRNSEYKMLGEPDTVTVTIRREA